MKRIAWAFLCSVALLAMACGPSSQPAPSGGGNSAADAPPKSGGTLKVRETTYYQEFDPTQALKGEATLITSKVMDSLLTFKKGAGVGYNDLILAPYLATSWDTSADGKSFTFHLRKGVKFQNTPPVNGREMTSEDVKWSFEYIARVGRFKTVKFPKSDQIDFKLQGLDSVDTPDPYTAIVHFKDPFGPFMTYVGTFEVAILPHENYEAGNMSKTPIGTGPWTADLPNWQSGAVMAFKKNPTYWDPGKPYLDGVNHIVVTDEGSAIAAFQTKQLDTYPSTYALSDSEEIKSKTPDAKFTDTLGWNALRVYYDVNVAPFNNLKFRQALSFATDREEFKRVVTKGQGAWGIDGGLPNMFTEEETKKMEPYDLAKAKQLLQESGYTANPITIECLYATGYGAQLLVDEQLLQAQWKKAGIDMKIVTTERDDLSARRRDGKNYMMAPTGAGAALEPEPDVYMWTYFHPTSGANYYHVNDPQLTKLADQQRLEVNPEKRMALWRQEAQYIHDNGLALWVYFPVFSSFYQPWVKGYYPHLSVGAAPTPDTWIDR